MSDVGWMNTPGVIPTTILPLKKIKEFRLGLFSPEEIVRSLFSLLDPWPFILDPTDSQVPKANI